MSWTKKTFNGVDGWAINYGAFTTVIGIQKPYMREDGKFAVFFQRYDINGKVSDVALYISKSKKQALNYAKKWMREHPNG